MKALALSLLAVVSGLVAAAQTSATVTATVETVDIDSGQRTVVLTDIAPQDAHLEAPNWSRSGKSLLVNKAGRLYKLPLDKPRLSKVHTGFAKACNNDHGYSFDGNTLIISHNDERVGTDGPNSRIFKLPATGGRPILVTENYPSYWHGISPDGQTLVYCAARNGEWEVYAISIQGGFEKRLTDAPGLDDGPEYSPDGKYIYFNAHRTGRMHVWRMNADGSNQRQLTHDEYDNWFPHPSPDGKWLAFISYQEDQKGQHPFGRNVKLRLMNLQKGDVKDLTDVFFGGQGSFNVPSWSPDSKQVAFVSYKLN
ncbi:MAG: PD40 domain-containing protein [Saprospiraceae bacterium]|nr:PD40 domain-containing protein [Saprospiraceae bacterium]